MTARGGHPGRVRVAQVELLMQALTERDWAIIVLTAQLRLLTGKHIERLHFSSLSLRSRAVVRWRVLKRLVDSRVLTSIPHRATSLHTSAELCYTLDSAGLRLMQIRA